MPPIMCRNWLPIVFGHRSPPLTHQFMPRLPHRPTLVTLWTAASLVLAATLCPPTLAVDFEQPDPLEPEIAEASDEGRQAMSTFKLREGWSIDLFAAEPDVANIVAFDIDDRGRVYVCETYRQGRGVTDNRNHDRAWLEADLSATTVQDRIDYHKRLLGESAITFAQQDDRIRRVIDTDGDHKADQVTTVANGFNHLEEGTGAGVLAVGNDIYYTCIPKLWKLVDADDDGEAEERIVLSDGYGVRVAFRGHDCHGLIIGPDGRLYFSIGDRGYHITTAEGNVLANSVSGAIFRCELDGSHLEVFADGVRNPQELAFNDVGDLFSVDNNSDSGDKARIIQVVEGSDSGWRMHYQYLGDRGIFNREKVWEPLHPEQTVTIVPPIANFTDGPSGLAYYPGTGFGDSLKDQFLICDFRGGPANSGVRSFQLTPDGAFYSLKSDDQPIWQTLVTDIKFGPDGALYFSDWVDGWNGLGKGRLYRVTDDRHHQEDIVKEVAALLSGDWSARTIDQLVSDLSHVDMRVRQRGQFQLAARNEIEPLLGVATNRKAGMVSRLHAIWGSEQIARRQSDVLPTVVSAMTKLVSDDVPEVAAAAITVLGDHGSVAAKLLVDQLGSDSARVQRAALLALTHQSVSSAQNAVLGLLAKTKNKDPILRHRCIVYLAETIEPAKLAKQSKHKSAFVRRCVVAALRRAGSSLVDRFLDDSNSLVVAEAARAIHDTPIPAAYPALAAKLLETNDSGLVWSESFGGVEAQRRAMNTLRRTGTAADAERLGRFAASTAVSSVLRIEALDHLQLWADLSPIDRYDHAHRPGPSRSQADAAGALEPHIDALLQSPEDVRLKAIETASQLGIARITPNLIVQATDSDLAPPQRAAALAAIARLKPAAAVKLAHKIGSEAPTPLLKAALTVLADHDAENSIPAFVQATRSRNPGVSQLGWDLLGQTDDPIATERIGEGVRQYIAGELPVAVSLNVIEAADNRLDDETKLQLADHQSMIAQTDPLGTNLVAIEGGDFEAGAKLFYEKTELSCVRCHRVHRTGGEVGPVLTTIGKQKDARYLLEAICLPDAAIAKGYETAIIASDSGRTYSGIIAAETDETVTLTQNDGTQVRLFQDEILARKKGKSSMPADLTKFMSQRELRDLVAYLVSLKIDPREVSDEEIE